VLTVAFTASRARDHLPWIDLEPWTRSRAVTVADIGGSLAPPALDVALCCDLVYLRAGARLLLPGPQEAPTDGVVWAAGRAGRAALARGVLTGGSVSCDEAVRLGLAQAVVAEASSLPLPDACSLAALTTARDLMRSRATRNPGLALELASFRLLFAAGEPEEGARAFLERRIPDFGRAGSSHDDPGD
jgi:enoyl-CoA hydratase/carnithine racemase